MATIQFSNGKKVNFEGTPTPEDVDFVAKQMGITAQDTQPTSAVQETKKPLIDKVSNTLGDIFGGKVIGEAIGTGVAKRQFERNDLPGALSPDKVQLAQELFKKRTGRDIDFSDEATKQNILNSGTFKQPTTTQIAGDVGRAALNFVPVGKIAQGLGAGAKAVPLLGKIAKPVANITTGTGIGYAADVTTKLAEGQEDPFKAGLGTAVGAGISSIPYVGKGLAKLGTEALGLSTGTGAGTIQEFTRAITKGGKQADEARAALRGNVNPQEIVEDAKTAFGTFIKERSDEYTKKLSALKTKTNLIDHAPIIERFNSQLEDFGVFVNKDGTPNFSRAPGLGRYEKDLTALSKTLAEWGSREGDNSIAGIDKLKQVIDDFRINSADSKKFDTFVTSLRNEAKNIIKGNLMKSKDLKTLATYNTMLSDFESKTKEIREIQKALSLGDKASVDTAFRKLSTVLRTNNEVRKQAVQQLNELTGGRLLPKIAGQQLSETLPRGLMRTLGGIGAGAGVVSGVGIIPMLKLALFSSPRVVGEMLNVLGIAGNKVNIVKDALLKAGIKSPGDYIFDSSYQPTKAAPIKNATTKGTPILKSPKMSAKPKAITKNFDQKSISNTTPESKGKSISSKKPPKLGKSQPGFITPKTLAAGAIGTAGLVPLIKSKKVGTPLAPSKPAIDTKSIGNALMQLESSGGTNKKNQDGNEMKWLTGLTPVAIKELKRLGIKDSVDINSKEDVIDASVKYFELMQKRNPNLTPAEVYVDKYWTQYTTSEQRKKKIDEFNKLVNI